MAEVTSTFLSAVKASTHSENYGGSLFYQGGYYQPHASGDPPRTEPWTLRPAGSTGTYSISEAAYASLAAGTDARAPYTGTYVDAAGVAHWLGVSGGAVAVLPSDPPPPPPP